MTSSAIRRMSGSILFACSAVNSFRGLYSTGSNLYYTARQSRNQRSHHAPRDALRHAERDDYFVPPATKLTVSSTTYASAVTGFFFSFGGSGGLTQTGSVITFDSATTVGFRVAFPQETSKGNFA